MRASAPGAESILNDVYGSAKKKIATIRNSRVVAGDADRYDFVREADRHAVVDRATSAVIASVQRRPGGAALDVTVDTYLPTGIRFTATLTGTNVAGLQMTGCVFEGLGVGVQIN